MNQTDAFSKGMKMFHDGEIRDAILAFQAHVQNDMMIVVKGGVCWEVPPRTRRRPSSD